MKTVEQILEQSPYIGYSYSYPHKTAYRNLSPSIPLKRMWEKEDRGALFLYMHVPFCEMRCGFCNLFTTANPADDLETSYVDALVRQSVRVKEVLGKAAFARMAIGGGTPTFLSVKQLDRLFDVAIELFEVDTAKTPISVETSPLTATPDKLELLHDYKVNRISIGIQSFIEREVAASGRAQKTQTVSRALDSIRKFDFPTLNIDLIYGLEGQTVESWLSSLQEALKYEPEEIYIYPLYVRPLTGLGRSVKSWDDIRLSCYRAGRDFLLSAGYRQHSMRMFRLNSVSEDAGPIYCCQDDGMVGLGCGARTYTSSLHSSNDYAIGAQTIHQILRNYMQSSPESFDFAVYGFAMNADEQRRRYIIQSLLQSGGLNAASYRKRFNASFIQDLPQLNELLQCGLAVEKDERLQLTERGMERSDAIGPWLYSDEVNGLMEAYSLK